MWISATVIFVAIAFIAVLVANGTVLSTGSDNNGTTGPTVTTLIARPVLPGDNSPETTASGASARCRDGTYSFRAGDTKVSDAELCKDNGGIEKRLS